MTSSRADREIDAWRWMESSRRGATQGFAADELLAVERQHCQRHEPWRAVGGAGPDQNNGFGAIGDLRDFAFLRRPGLGSKAKRLQRVGKAARFVLFARGRRNVDVRHSSPTSRFR